MDLLHRTKQPASLGMRKFTLKSVIKKKPLIKKIPCKQNKNKQSAKHGL